MTTTTTSKGNIKNLITTKGTVKFLSLAKPRAALNKKDAAGNEVLEYSLRLELPNNAIGKAGDEAPTSLKELLKAIEGKTRMSRVTNDTGATYQVNFKSKKQPKVYVGVGENARLLTSEELQAEFGRFDSRQDTAEASVSAVILSSDVPGRSPTIALTSVNILSSTINPKADFVSTQDGIAELDAIYNQK